MSKIVKGFVILFCFLGFLVSTSCASRSKHFGLVIMNRSSSYHSPMDIYRIPDSTQNKIEQLTFTPTVGEYGLFVSKNGGKIIFRTDHYASSEMEPSELEIEELRHVYYLDTTSKELVDITNVLEDEYPQLGPEFYMDWSPDQKQFVVIKYEGTEYEIKSFLEFVDFDGTNRKDVFIPKVGEIPALINSVKWSPDGKKFMLTQGAIGLEQQMQNPGNPILIYNLESENIVQITDYQDQCWPQEWSPTNQQIVVICSFYIPYVEGISGPSTVRIFDVENPGQAYERIGFSPCYDPSWSPDGKQLAFACDKGTEQMGLFVANSDGSGIREVKLGDFGNPAVLKNPTWSPYGKQIVYVAGTDNYHTNIYSVHTDGSNNHSITNQDAYYNLVSVYPLP